MQRYYYIKSITLVLQWLKKAFKGKKQGKRGSPLHPANYQTGINRNKYVT